MAAVTTALFCSQRSVVFSLPVSVEVSKQYLHLIVEDKMDHLLNSEVFCLERKIIGFTPKLEPMTCNLSDERARHYTKLSMN